MAWAAGQFHVRQPDNSQIKFYFLLIRSLYNLQKFPYLRPFFTFVFLNACNIPREIMPKSQKLCRIMGMDFQRLLRPVMHLSK